MAFSSNNTKVKGVPKNNLSTPITHNIELTDKEVELVLVTIKNSLFKGEYVETLFNLTLKLQEKYKQIKK